MFILDAHLDLAMNALEWNRDLRRPLEDIRKRESHLADKPDRGRGTVSLPDMRRGGIGVCVATQIARYVKTSNHLPGWNSPEQAWAQTQGQLAWYRVMEERGEMAAITDLASLDRSVAAWSGFQASNPESHARTPIGYVLSLEGADSILAPKRIEPAYEQGLRALGLSHYGPGTYAQGTDSVGGLGLHGRELLDEMERLGIILDVTHLSDESFWEAVDYYNGPLWASHCNCRSLTPHQRQLSDDMIKVLVQRGGVIGCVLDAWMMIPGWVRGKTTPQSAGLQLSKLVEHLDHVCQIAGNARHAGLGSDLDGAFGREQCPADLESIADLSRVGAMLAARGFKSSDVQLVMNGNFLRFLRGAWSRGREKNPAGSS